MFVGSSRLLDSTWRISQQSGRRFCWAPCFDLWNMETNRVIKRSYISGLSLLTNPTYLYGISRKWSRNEEVIRRMLVKKEEAKLTRYEQEPRFQLSLNKKSVQCSYFSVGVSLLNPQHVSHVIILREGNWKYSAAMVLFPPEWMNLNWRWRREIRTIRTLSWGTSRFSPLPLLIQYLHHWYNYFCSLGWGSINYQL